MLKYLENSYPDLCELISLEKGDILVLNDYSSQLYFVMKGYVQLGKLNTYYKIVTIVFLKIRGCFIPSNNHKYQMKALTRSNILVIKRKSLHCILKKKPTFFYFLIYGIYIYNATLEEFSLIYIPKTTWKRVILLLLFLAKNVGKKFTEGIRLTIKLSQADIAQITGSTRASISKVLKSLQKAKCILIFDGKIVIKDLVYLAQLSNRKNIN